MSNGQRADSVKVELCDKCHKPHLILCNEQGQDFGYVVINDALLDRLQRAMLGPDRIKMLTLTHATEALEPIIAEVRTVLDKARKKIKRRKHK